MSFDELFMQTALLYSKRSTCCRLQTGCVLVKNNNVISTGYNGTVSGDKHCETHWRQVHKDLYKERYQTFEQFLQGDEFKNQHHAFSTSNEIHAEENCLLRASRKDTLGSTLYTVYSPCIHCAKTIVTLKVAKVFYLNEYRDTEGIRFCERNGIVVQRMTL